jgi:hypothetical protein
MVKRKIKIVISNLIMIFIINCCINCIVFGLENASSSHSKNSNQDAIGDQTHLRFEQVQFAKAVRNLIDSLCQQENGKDLIASLRSKVASEIMISDSSLGNQILNKLDNDSSFIEDCLYVADLKKNWNSIQSEHFIFYFKNDGSPDTSAMHQWGEHFERLSETFGTKIPEKIPFKIDNSEKYGRCFAPWEVRWGIKQGGVGNNPHELAHIMLFKYSDVPFFHEPLAFIYGTYKGDFSAVFEYLLKHTKIIADSGYVSATEILHFPSIIGLQKSKWASSFYFIYKLVTKYDVEQLLVLIRRTPWKSSVADFSDNFKEVYRIELTEFEHNILKEINH